VGDGPTDDDRDARPAYGTAAQDAPITRADFERALRYLNLADLELRDQIVRLGGQVVALTDELVRRIDRVEPEPAPPGTPVAETNGTVEQAVAAATPHAQMMMRVGDERVPGRVAIDIIADKYQAEAADIPCAELVHLCQARCCSFTFSLSTQDLDEGVIRWDYGQPYLIRQRASDGYCSHHDPDSRGCTVHEFRPRVCRVYDCRDDPRIWLDYAQRIPAPPITPGGREVKIDLLARAKARYEAIEGETRSMRNRVADDAPVTGPPAETTKRPDRR
jgi:hypothetical protein